MSSSTRPSRLGSRSAYDVTAPRMRRQAAGGSTGQPRPAQTPSFHGVPRGTSGQAAMPSAAGRTACQTSTYGWPSDPHVRRHHLRGQPGLLAAGHQVVDEHAEPALRPGREVAHHRRQVVDAAEVLDDDALDAQVVAPHLLDQLGVVPALDVDPAAAGDPGAGAGHRRPTRRRYAGAPPPRARRRAGPARPARRRPGSPARAGRPGAGRAGPRASRSSRRRSSRSAPRRRRSRSRRPRRPGRARPRPAAGPGAAAGRPPARRPGTCPRRQASRSAAAAGS